MIFELPDGTKHTIKFGTAIRHITFKKHNKPTAVTIHPAEVFAIKWPRPKVVGYIKAIYKKLAK